MVGGEEHDDFESIAGGVEHYSWAEIPKKEARKMRETSGRHEGRDSYRQANTTAKKAVAQPRRGQ